MDDHTVAMNSNNKSYEALSHSIERALNNSALFKKELVHKYDYSFNAVSSEFLKCPSKDLFESVESFETPISLIFGANFYNFIRTSYKTMDDEIDEIEKQLNLEGCYQISGSSLLIEGPLFSSTSNIYYALPVPNKGIYFPDEAIAAIEDEEGFRLMVKRESRWSGGSILTILADRRSPLHLLKIEQFRKKLEAYCRKNRIFNKGIYDRFGTPVPLVETNWSELKISEKTREEIDFHIVNYIEQIGEIGKAQLNTSRGVILFGKQGNGKTLLSRILASNLNVPVIQLTPKSFENLWGQPSTEEVYAFADFISPCIVLIEDGDLFFKDRNVLLNPTWDLGEFLNKIDELSKNNGVLTILTVNSPKFLDEVMENRPKLFDVMIELPNPGQKEREEIISDIISLRISKETEGIIAEIATRLDGFSGAHVRKFSETLVLNCIYKSKAYITHQILNEELKKFGFKPVHRPEHSNGSDLVN